MKLTNRETTEQRPRKRVTPRLVMTVACYLCVLAVAIRVDGMVEAQAEYRELTQQAETLRVENLDARAMAQSDAALLAQQNAATLATLQQQEQQLREEAAKAAAKTPAATGTAGSNAPKTPATPAAPVGQFNAAAYAGGYSGTSKVSYWKGVNSDTMGYLYIPGTNISTPILLNTQDVNYYTNRDVYGNYVKGGAVAWTNPNTNAASTVSGMSPNTVIYGHNWTNYSANPRIGSGSDVYFAQLTGYHHLSMAKSYPYFYFALPDETVTFKIFATFYTELAFNYIATEGGDYIINEAMNRSRHNFNVDVNSGDKIITLSTCTRAYGSTNNQRFVVMGRALRPGESATEVNVVSNPNHKQPSVW